MLQPAALGTKKTSHRHLHRRLAGFQAGASDHVAGEDIGSTVISGQLIRTPECWSHEAAGGRKPENGLSDGACSALAGTFATNSGIRGWACLVIGDRHVSTQRQRGGGSRVKQFPTNEQPRHAAALAWLAGDIWSARSLEHLVAEPTVFGTASQPDGDFPLRNYSRASSPVSSARGQSSTTMLNTPRARRETLHQCGRELDLSEKDTGSFRHFISVAGRGDQ